jgi:hypothetical protein
MYLGKVLILFIHKIKVVFELVKNGILLSNRKFKTTFILWLICIYLFLIMK